MGSQIQVAPNVNVFFHDYQPPNTHSSDDHLTVLCLHGITRNADDFIPMVNQLHAETDAQSCRFIVPDMRGRGRSDYDENLENYMVGTYVADCWKLLDSLETQRVAIIGTSMGGIMSILMHEQRPEQVSGILLNDIGPIVPKQGLAYILTYLGKFMSEDTWAAALETTKKRLADEYVNLPEKEWEQIALRTYAQRQDGSWSQRYDKNIRLPMLAAFEQGEELDLWQAYSAIDKPLLLLRGERSKLLPQELAQAMLQQNKHCKMAEIQDRGHVPLLDEPESLMQIKEWLNQMRQQIG